MADIVRTKQQMLTDYSDNDVRSITANTHRNGVMSYLGCIGQISNPDNPTSLSGTPAVVEFQDSDIEVDLTNSLDTSAGIEADGAGLLGVYHILWMLAIEADDADQQVGLQLYADGSPIGDLWPYQIIDSKPATLCGHMLYEMTSLEKIDLRITGSDTVTYDAGHLSLQRVG